MFITPDRDRNDEAIEYVAQEGDIRITKVDGNEYERGSWWWYNIALWIMKAMENWAVSKQNIAERLDIETERTAWPFDREGAWTKEYMMEHATEWIALDVHYPLAGESFWSFYHSDKTKDIIDAIWIKYLLHHQAVRNRFRIVKKLLMKNIERFLCSDMDEVRILGLASGSGRDVIDVLANIKNTNPEVLPKIKVFLTDMKNDPLDEVKELAEEREVSEQVRCSREIIRPNQPERLASMVEEYQPHLAYNIGFFDYWKDETVLKMKQAIRKGLNEQGVFISGNIIPNPEMKFLPAVITWDRMYHRTPKEYAELVRRAGFSSVNVYVEPNEIFAIGEAYVNSLP